MQKDQDDKKEGAVGGLVGTVTRVKGADPLVALLTVSFHQSQCE